MANRSNHYEAAFEGFIRSLRVPCVAIDEAKRAIFGEDGLKNPDFLLYPCFGTNLVVEVKGKRGKDSRGVRAWENWVTTDDLEALVRWQSMFGPGFRAVLAFAYAEPIQPFPLPRDNGAYEFRGREYRFWAVGLDDYIAHLRSRGPGVEGRRDGPPGVPPPRPAAAGMAADDPRFLPTTRPRQGTRTMTSLLEAIRPADRPPAAGPRARAVPGR